MDYCETVNTHIPSGIGVGHRCFHAIMIVIASGWQCRVSACITPTVSWLCVHTDVFSFPKQLIPGLLFWVVINCMRVKEKSRISVKTVPRLYSHTNTHKGSARFSHKHASARGNKRQMSINKNIRCNLHKNKSLGFFML